MICVGKDSLLFERGLLGLDKPPASISVKSGVCVCVRACVCVVCVCACVRACVCVFHLRPVYVNGRVSVSTYVCVNACTIIKLIFSVTFNLYLSRISLVGLTLSRSPEMVRF